MAAPGGIAGGLLVAALGCAASAAPLQAGPNAGVEVGIAMVSAPCQLSGGDQVEFYVAARGMADVRQVRLDLSWQPPGAVASATGGAAGVAEAAHFLVPGPPQIQGNRAEFGMASFSDAVDGEGILAHLSFTLAGQVDSGTPVDIRVERVLLGPTSTTRDTILPEQALALANYCDDAGSPLDLGVFICPPQQRALLSPEGSGAVEDGSAGEVLLSGRVLSSGTFLSGQPLTWTIANAGSLPVYVLAAAGTLTVAPGARQLGVSRTDSRGEAYMLLDAEAGFLAGGAAAEVEACAGKDGQPLCADAAVTWEGTVTAVTWAEGAALPQRPRLQPPYPNPCNPTTTVPVVVADGLADVVVDVLDMAGRPVKVLVAGGLGPGRHALRWDGRDEQAREVASGLYFCRLRWGAGQQVQPVVLLR